VRASYNPWLFGSVPADRGYAIFSPHQKKRKKDNNKDLKSEQYLNSQKGRGLLKLSTSCNSFIMGWKMQKDLGKDKVQEKVRKGTRRCTKCPKQVQKKCVEVVHKLFPVQNISISIV